MPRTCPLHVPVQCFQNIDTDQRVSDDLRDEIVHLLAAAADQKDAATTYNRWCQSALADGRVLPSPIGDFANGERLGHLRYRGNFASNISDVLRADRAHGGVDETDIEELVKWLFGEPSNIEIAAATFLFTLILAECPIDTRRAWLFRTDHRDHEPFASYDVTCLPWQLGLPLARSGSSYVGLDVNAAALTDARFATFVDVIWSSLAFWRPTGRTEPRDDSPSTCERVGLTELLANAPKFRDIRFPSFTFSAK